MGQSHVRGNIAANRVRGSCLASSANVVTLALDREQRGGPDGAAVHQPPAVAECAFRKSVLEENTFHGFQIEFGG